MILGLQIIALLFVLVMFYFTYLHFRRKELNLIEAIGMLIAWSGAVLIILMPRLFSAFSQSIAISRAFDLAVIGGFIFVFPLVYLAYIRTRRLERKIEKYIRNEALTRAKIELKKKNNVKKR